MRKLTNVVVGDPNTLFKRLGKSRAQELGVSSVWTRSMVQHLHRQRECRNRLQATTVKEQERAVDVFGVVITALLDKAGVTAVFGRAASWLPSSIRNVTSKLWYHIRHNALFVSLCMTIYRVLKVCVCVYFIPDAGLIDVLDYLGRLFGISTKKYIRMTRCKGSLIVCVLKELPGMMADLFALKGSWIHQVFDKLFGSRVAVARKAFNMAKLMTKYDKAIATLDRMNKTSVHQLLSVKVVNNLSVALSILTVVPQLLIGFLDLFLWLFEKWLPSALLKPLRRFSAGAHNVADFVSDVAAIAHGAHVVMFIAQEILFLSKCLLSRLGFPVDCDCFGIRHITNDDLKKYRQENYDDEQLQKLHQQGKFYGRGTFDTFDADGEIRELPGARASYKAEMLKLTDDYIGARDRMWGKQQ